MKRQSAELDKRKRVSWASIGARFLLALLGVILLFTLGAMVLGGAIPDIKSGFWWRQQTAEYWSE